MDTRFLWSNVDSPIGSVVFQAEDLVGLTVRNHAEWDDDDEDWDEEEGWDEEGVEAEDEGDEDWDDEDDEDLDDEDD
jgi:hypothetical protein